MNLKTDKFVDLPRALREIDLVMQSLEATQRWLMQKGPHGPVMGFEVGVVGGIMDTLDSFQGMLKENFTDDLDEDPE